MTTVDDYSRWENKTNTQNKASAETAALMSIRKERAMSLQKQWKWNKNNLITDSLMLSSSIKKILRIILFFINYKKINLTKLWLFRMIKFHFKNLSW